MTPVRDPVDELHEALFVLRDAVRDAALLIGDAPLYGRVQLVDGLADEAADLAGVCEEGIAVAVAAPEGRPRALAECAERLATARAKYFERIASYDVLNDLLELGRYRGNDWEIWAAQVKTKIEDCRQPLEDAGSALVRNLLETAHAAPTAS